MVTSGLLTLLAIAAVIYPGLNYGLDFTGGILVEVRYPAPPDLEAIRTELTDAGFEQVQATSSGSDALIRLPPPEEGAEGAAWRAWQRKLHGDAAARVGDDPPNRRRA